MLDWNNNGMIDPVDIGISIALQNNNADSSNEDIHKQIEKIRKEPHKCISSYINRRFRQIRETLGGHV